MPGPGPFELFRGVAGRGRARRVRGFSWTASEKTAEWFADRAGEWGLHDPAVFRMEVNADNVFAYCNEREEQEFIVDHSALKKPKRTLWKPTARHVA